MRTLKHIVRLITLSMSFLWAGSVYSQNLKLELADHLMSQFDFKKASEIYQDILKKDPVHYQAIKNSALCYTKLQESVQAEKQYKLLDSLKKATSEDLLLLAQALKRNRKYDEAYEIYTKHGTLFPGNPLVQKYLKDENWANKINRDSSLFRLKNCEINSKFSDFAPCFFDQSVIFSSSRAEGKRSFQGNYSWNNQAYLNLFKAELTLDSNLVRPKVIDSHLNSRYHEGTVTFNKVERALYLTRNHFNKGTRKKDQDGYLNLAVYQTRDFNGEFEDLTPFPFNSPEYSVGHPSVSDDGKTLYFTSDMPGGQGGTDIYKTSWDGSKWTEPKNLGPLINTPSNEMFPHIFENTLYFSSNGHVGLGGLDIHQTDITEDGFGEVINSGYPLNSSYDDFSIIFSQDGKSGFLSSNRPGGHGDDDIYKFYISKPQFITITGKVLDERTSYPVVGASIYLKDESETSKIELVGNTNDRGEYEFTVPYQESFELLGSKKGYFELKKKVASNPTTSYIDNVNFSLKQYDYLAEGHVLFAENETPMKGAKLTLSDETGAIIEEKYTGTDGYYSFGLYKGKVYKITCEKEDYALQSSSCDTRNRQSTVFEHDFRMFQNKKGVVVRIPNIYYDYNKSDIRSDAAKELRNLVNILNDNPDMRIELSSHTDSRGSDSYNLNLSTKRAKSAVDYIISEGISSSRIKSRGYGEKKIKNHCKNGVDCSESEHEVNRRTEFTIL